MLRVNSSIGPIFCRQECRHSLPIHRLGTELYNTELLHSHALVYPILTPYCRCFISSSDPLVTISLSGLRRLRGTKGLALFRTHSTLGRFKQARQACSFKYCSRSNHPGKTLGCKIDLWHAMTSEPGQDILTILSGNLTNMRQPIRRIPHYCSRVSLDHQLVNRPTYFPSTLDSYMHGCPPIQQNFAAYIHRNNGLRIPALDYHH